MLNVGQKVSELRRMNVGELRREYAEVFGEQTRSFHKEFLVRRIAWRVQANAEGGLPDRARRRAAELADDTDQRKRALEIANDADLRTRAPSGGADPVKVAARAPGGRVVTKREEEVRSSPTRMERSAFMSGASTPGLGPPLGTSRDVRRAAAASELRPPPAPRGWPAA